MVQMIAFNKSFLNIKVLRNDDLSIQRRLSIIKHRLI